MSPICIMGIDPGSRNLGVAIMEIDIDTLEIIDIIPIPISLNKYLINNYKTSHLYSRLTVLRREFEDIIDTFNPIAVAVESGFINPKMPGAVIPLANVLAIMTNVILENDTDTMIIEYPPSIIKKTIGANPVGNKSPVLEAISNNEEIKEIVDIDLLTEHNVDSIAIAYTLLVNLRKEGVLCLI